MLYPSHPRVLDLERRFGNGLPAVEESSRPVLNPKTSGQGWGKEKTQVALAGKACCSQGKASPSPSNRAHPSPLPLAIWGRRPSHPTAGHRTDVDAETGPQGRGEASGSGVTASVSPLRCHPVCRGGRMEGLTPAQQSPRTPRRLQRPCQRRAKGRSGKAPLPPQGCSQPTAAVAGGETPLASPPPRAAKRWLYLRCFSSSPEPRPRRAANVRRRGPGSQEDLARESEEAGRGFFSWQVAPRALPSRGGGTGAVLLLFWPRTPRFGVAAGPLGTGRRGCCQQAGDGAAGSCPWGQPAFAHLLASLNPWQGFLRAAGQNLPRGQQGLAQAGLLHTSAPPRPGI